MKTALAALVLLVTSIGPALAQGQTETQRAEAYYHFAKARMYDEDGQWSQAITEYRKALELDPDNSMIHSEMAETYFHHRRIREAVETAEKAIRLDPNNIEAHKLLSTIYANSIGNDNARQASSDDIVEKAAKEFEEIVRIDPNERQAYLMLGRLYQLQKKPEKALEIYKKFLNLEPGSEEGAVALAKLQMDAGNNHEAITILESFLQQQPESGKALELLGQVYESIQEFGKAADAYKRAIGIDQDQDNVELRKGLAQALFFEDRFDDAAREYEKLAQAEPDDGLSLLRLGQIYRRQMKYGESREKLEKVVKMFPESIEAQFNLALLDRDEGFLEEALKRIQEILLKTEKPIERYTEADKQNRRVFFTHLALLNSNLDRFDAAVRAFKEVKALALDAGPRVEASIVDTYRTAKDLDKAIEYCQSALKEYPGNPQLQMIYADLIAEKGHPEEAVSMLHKMLQSREADLEVLSTIVQVQQRAKQFSAAEAVVVRAIQQFPKNEQVYFLQGALYERQKKFDDAEKAFRKALEINEKSAPVLNYLGYMLADRGVKLEEALRMVKQAVESDPANGAYLDSLGWVYFRLNRMDLAEEYLKRALRFAHRDPTIHEHLGDLYFKTQRFDEARIEWTKSVELGTEPEEIEKVKKKLDGLKTKVAKKQ